MIDVKQEAEDFWMDYEHREGSLHRNCFIDGFILGTNSKYVQAKVLYFAIDKFKSLTEKQSGFSFKDVLATLEILEEQLKQIENDNPNP